MWFENRRSASRVRQAGVREACPRTNEPVSRKFATIRQTNGPPFVGAAFKATSTSLPVAHQMLAAQDAKRRRLASCGMCFACLRDDCGKRRPNDALSTLHDSRRFFCQPATPAGNLTCGTPRAPFLARSAEHASDTLIYPSFRPLHKLRRQAQVRRLRCVAFYSRYIASARPSLRAFTARRIFSHPSPRLRTATLQRAHAPRAPKPPSPAPNAQSLATVRLVNCLKRSPFSQPLSQACASNRV